MITFGRNDTTIFGRWWWTVDRLSFFAILGLILLGVLLVLAASPGVAEQHNWNPYYFVKKHLLFLIPTLFVMIGISLLSVKQIQILSFVMLFFSFIALLAVPFMGVEIKGAKRWLDFMGVSIQPSEFIKPSFTVVCAWAFAHNRATPDFPGNIVAIGLYCLVAALLLLQPDLGMTAVITLIWFCQFFLAGLPLIWIISASLAGISGLVGAYYIFPHVSKRIDHFLYPEVGDRYGDRYQITQSLEAFMNGGFSGRGPGEGVIKKYLPDAHADFIFAVAGEEFGMMLCILLIFLFAFIIVRSFSRILQEHSLFIILAVTGLLVQFGLQAIINMASTLNLIPTKGMTLPFISYGGSSMLALAIGMGMMLGLTRKRVGGK